MSSKDKTPSFQLDINPETTPVYYTDNINIAINEDGVVLNFCQKIVPGKYKVVARIGMNQAHAEKFVQKLGNLLVNENKLQSSASLKH